MLRSQAALCLFTGSFEMSVFQMLLAGKSGQLASVAAGPRGADNGAAAGAAAAPLQAASSVATSASSNGLVCKPGRILLRILTRPMLARQDLE